MRKIRVLVVDDAVVVRKIVTDTLSGDPDLDIVVACPPKTDPVAMLGSGSKTY